MPPPEGVEKDEELLVEVRMEAVREDVEVVGEKRMKKDKKKGKAKSQVPLDGDGIEEDEGEGLVGFLGVESAFVEADEKLVTKVVRKDSESWQG